jgi:hypothetical protein
VLIFLAGSKVSEFDPAWYKKNGQFNSNNMNEESILKWANNKLKTANKSTKINSFDDATLKNSLPLLDLIDAIRPER